MGGKFKPIQVPEAAHAHFKAMCKQAGITMSEGFVQLIAGHFIGEVTSGIEEVIDRRLEHWGLLNKKKEVPQPLIDCQLCENTGYAEPDNSASFVTCGCTIGQEVEADLLREELQ